MTRRLVITAVAATAVAGAVVPSFAQSAPPSPVTVHVSQTNGVSVGVAVTGQNVAGATVSNSGQVCAGISEQVPVCAGVVQPRPQRQSLPVVVRQDDTGTTVGVGVVGVHVSNDGQVCPLVSTQTWQCVGGGTH